MKKLHQLHIFNRRLHIGLFIVGFVFASLGTFSLKKSSGLQTVASAFAEATHTYICPMHCENLKFDEAGSCPVCGMDLVEEAALESHQIKTALMPGLDQLFYYLGWLGLLLATFIGWKGGSRFRISTRRDPYRGSPKRLGFLTTLAKSRWFPFIFQVPVVLVFLFVIFAGLFGNQEPGRNIATILTWNIWWMGLIFLAFFLGQGWCTVCPWMAIPDWFLNLPSPFRRGESGGGKRWPKKLRNLYLALFLLFFISWLELAYDASFRPGLTAWMAIGMVVGATLVLFSFERKTFCRYLCPVGRATGAYGMTGIAAIRRVDSDVCKRCQTKDCYHGNEHGLGCPTFEFMGALNDNMYCIMCAECLKTCPSNNIEVQVRRPFADVLGSHHRRLDEAILLVAMAAVAVFHGLSMVPFWDEYLLKPGRAFLKSTVGDPGFYVSYTAGLLLFVLAVFAMYVIAIASIRWISGNLVYRFRRYFVAFSYSTLPISLAYHLSHNSLHFFYEGSKLVKLASDPFGWDWNLFGTADMAPTMLVPMPLLFAIQILILITGHGIAILAVGQISRSLIGNRMQAFRARIPLSVFIFVFSGVCLWLLHQPMFMRTG